MESRPTASVPVPAPSAARQVNRLQESAAGERPQERLEQFGPAALSDTELIALLLRNGTRGCDVLSLASRLLAAAGDLAGLASWREADFRRLPGIGRVKALQLVTALELARRVPVRQSGDAPLLNRPELIASYFHPLVSGLQVEKFWVLCLNRRNRLLKRIEISSGTATAALAHPREVYREAVREAATAVVCVHNHPSGDPSPSTADLSVTRQLREASRALDIELLDHVILGQAGRDPAGVGHYSFRAAGLL